MKNPYELDQAEHDRVYAEIAEDWLAAGETQAKPITLDGGHVSGGAGGREIGCQSLHARAWIGEGMRRHLRRAVDVDMARVRRRDADTSAHRHRRGC